MKLLFRRGNLAAEDLTPQGGLTKYGRLVGTPYG